MNTTSVRSTRSLLREAKRAASVRVCSASSPVNRPTNLRIKVSAESHISTRSIPPPWYVSSRKNHRPCPFQRAFPYELSSNETAGLVPEGGRRKLFESNRDCRMHLDKRRPNAGKAAMWARYVLFQKARRPSC